MEVSLRDESQFVSCLSVCALYLRPLKSQNFGFLGDLLMSEGKRGNKQPFVDVWSRRKPQLYAWLPKGGWGERW